MRPNVVRVDTTRSRYSFDTLKHGDMLEVRSKSGALEMFRRWKKASKLNRGRLLPSRESPNILIFIDDSLV